MRFELLLNTLHAAEHELRQPNGYDNDVLELLTHAADCVAEATLRIQQANARLERIGD